MLGWVGGRVRQRHSGGDAEAERGSASQGWKTLLQTTARCCFDEILHRMSTGKGHGTNAQSCEVDLSSGQFWSDTAITV